MLVQDLPALGKERMVEPKTSFGPFFSLLLYYYYVKYMQNTHEVAFVNVPKASWHLCGIYFGSAK